MLSKIVQEKAKEQEDQLNSEIRTLDMAGTFLPLTIKSLEEVNVEREINDHVTAVKADTLKLIVQISKRLNFLLISSVWLSSMVNVSIPNAELMISTPAGL
ncbi:hypothetical protein Tco_1099620 [Tanacetum coccineum]